MVFPAPLILVPLAMGPQPLVLALLFAAEFVSALGVMILDITAGAVLCQDSIDAVAQGARSACQDGRSGRAAARLRDRVPTQPRRTCRARWATNPRATRRYDRIRHDLVRKWFGSCHPLWPKPAGDRSQIPSKDSPQATMVSSPFLDSMLVKHSHECGGVDGLVLVPVEYDGVVLFERACVFAVLPDLRHEAVECHRSRYEVVFVPHEGQAAGLSAPSVVHNAAAGSRKAHWVAIIIGRLTATSRATRSAVRPIGCSPSSSSSWSALAK